MNSKIFKWIVIILIIGSIYYLGKQFPEETILFLGIGLIIIIGILMSKIDKE